MVDWKGITKKEFKKISEISNRAVALCKKSDELPDIDKMDLDMDIGAVHANGIKLDLDKFFKFPDFDFMHDVFGIQRHIDRGTGTLQDCFVPRCAA